ncbi:MAG: universal stress protein [Coriobacteriia bacterium]|nr:universal stress protein [Coriobacteriia bacterium]MBS5477190.1 universal stress protein [Coriobacteriia bacterium]
MIDILVGIDGSERGERALVWASLYARRVQGGLTLLTVVDPSAARQVGVQAEEAVRSAEKALAARRDELVARCPGMAVEARVVQGKPVDGIVDAAAGHSMIVVGTHHGLSVGEAIGGAKGLRVSVSVSIPTVVVPAGWAPEDEGAGIVVGVGPDQVSENAVTFGVQESLSTGEPLELVSVWGLPPFLEVPAEVMGGGVGPVGVSFQHKLDDRVRLLGDTHPGLCVSGHAVEGSSPAKALIERSRGHRMLVLGTHSRTALGRALFGSTAHAVLLSPSVPTVVVPLP